MEHVPSIEELSKRGLATPTMRTQKGAATHWRISPEGQRIIYEAMHRNAIELREQDAERLAARPPAPRRNF